MENNNKGVLALQIIGSVFGFLGTMFMLFGLVLIIDHHEKSKVYIETISTVIEHKQEDENTYYYVVEYEVDGKTYTKTSDVATSNPKKIGKEISIKYNPDNPSEAIWTKDYDTIILPIISVIFIVACVILFAASGKVKKYNIKKEKEENSLYTSKALEEVIKNSEKKDILDED